MVLDNFEHVLAAAPLVSALLAHCLRLRCLISSREQLDVPGESLLVVQPLAVPSVDCALGELASNPSIALFVSRAAEVLPGFEVTTGNAQVIGAQFAVN